MSGIDQTNTYTSLWQVVRDDEADAYQVIDAREAVIATVPVGGLKSEIARQRYVRDLIVAAPGLRVAAEQVVAELEKETPDLELCRSILGRAIAAARGQ